MNAVRSFLKPWAGRRVLILGVGSSSKGDDAAGPELIRRLRGKTSAQLMDGGSMPENRIRDISALKPELILLVDAARFDAEPGQVRLIQEQDIGSAGAGTHGLPLSMLLAYLRAEFSFATALIGIQPKSLEFDEPISPEVEKTLTDLEKVLQEAFPAGS